MEMYCGLHTIGCIDKQHYSVDFNTIPMFLVYDSRGISTFTPTPITLLISFSEYNVKGIGGEL